MMQQAKGRKENNDSQASLTSESESISSMDLLAEILIRLDAKTLGRCKCVCKSWYNLINNNDNGRDFILRHVNQSLSTTNNLHMASLAYDSKKPSTLYVVDLPILDSSPRPPFRTLTLPFTARGPYADIIGSCHGLICISDYPNFIALYNPTTKTHQVIPPFEAPTVDIYWVSFGFGYDSVSDDYVIFKVEDMLGAKYVHVFRLKENRWRKVDQDFPLFLVHPKRPGRFLNNSLHWVACEERYDYEVPKGSRVIFPSYELFTGADHGDGLFSMYTSYKIVAFDVCTEKFSVIDMPDDLDCHDYSPSEEETRFEGPPSIAVVWGNLVVQVPSSIPPSGSRGLNVWSMREYGVKESWIRIYSFHYGQVPSKVFWRRTPVLTSVTPDGGMSIESSEATKVYFWCDLRKFRDANYVFSSQLEPFSWLCIDLPFHTELFVDSMIVLNNVGLQHAEFQEEVADDDADRRWW